MIGHWETILIVLAVLVLFGSKKIPEFLGGLGKGVKEFKKGMNSEKTEKEIESEE